MFDTIADLLEILLPGLGVLAGLAWTIGRIDAGARHSAWRRIADARRERHEEKRDVIECFDGRPCPGCPMRKYLRDDLAD
jgi:hypothetical protein